MVVVEADTGSKRGGSLTDAIKVGPLQSRDSSSEGDKG